MDLRFWRKSTPLEVVNEDKKAPAEINDKLVKQHIDRIRESLNDWADAVTDAESPDMPESIKYHNLFNLFNNIEFDEHITALTETIYNDVTQTPFNIINEAGEIDEDKTKLFQKSWFFDFVFYVLQADSWKFSLIQFDDIVNGIFSGVTLVDRYYIRPDGGYVSRDKWQDTKDIDYKTAPYKNWTIFVQSRLKLGRYNVVAKSFILKREVKQFWAVFNELFTTPYYVVKTNFGNSKHRNDLINWIEKRKHSGAVVVGSDDEIDALTNSGAGYKSYEDFENKADQSMSKAYLGGTMVLDDGSSRSQSEVHERGKDTFVQAKRIMLALLINEELIPKMQNLGIKINSNDVFKWNLSQNLTVTEWVEIITKLAVSFDFDLEEIIEKIGLTLTNKEQINTFADAADKKEDIAEKIKNLYKNPIQNKA